MLLDTEDTEVKWAAIQTVKSLHYSKAQNFGKFTEYMLENPGEDYDVFDALTGESFQEKYINAFEQICSGIPVTDQARWRGLSSSGSMLPFVFKLESVCHGLGEVVSNCLATKYLRQIPNVIAVTLIPQTLKLFPTCKLRIGNLKVCYRLSFFTYCSGARFMCYPTTSFWGTLSLGNSNCPNSTNFLIGDTFNNIDFVIFERITEDFKAVSFVPETLPLSTFRTSSNTCWFNSIVRAIMNNSYLLESLIHQEPGNNFIARMKKIIATALFGRCSFAPIDIVTKTEMRNVLSLLTGEVAVGSQNDSAEVYPAIAECLNFEPSVVETYNGSEVSTEKSHIISLNVTTGSLNSALDEFCHFVTQSIDNEIIEVYKKIRGVDGSNPSTLTFAVGRGVFDPGTRSMQFSTQEFEFPRVLDLGQFVDSEEPSMYCLSAILLREGLTIDDGHWTCICPIIQTDLFIDFNDPSPATLLRVPFNEPCPSRWNATVSMLQFTRIDGIPPFRVNEWGQFCTGDIDHHDDIISCSPSAAFFLKTVVPTSVDMMQLPPSGKAEAELRALFSQRLELRVHLSDGTVKSLESQCDFLSDMDVVTQKRARLFALVKEFGTDKDIKYYSSETGIKPSRVAKMIKSIKSGQFSVMGGKMGRPTKVPQDVIIHQIQYILQQDPSQSLNCLACTVSAHLNSSISYKTVSRLLANHSVVQQIGNHFRMILISYNEMFGNHELQQVPLDHDKLINMIPRLGQYVSKPSLKDHDIHETISHLQQYLASNEGNLDEWLVVGMYHWQIRANIWRQENEEDHRRISVQGPVVALIALSCTGEHHILIDEVDDHRTVPCQDEITQFFAALNQGKKCIYLDRDDNGLINRVLTSFSEIEIIPMRRNCFLPRGRLDPAYLHPSLERLFLHWQERIREKALSWHAGQAPIAADMAAAFNELDDVLVAGTLSSILN